MMDSLTHFDPLNLAVVILGIVGAWFTLIRDSRWHSEWIKKHSIECDEHRQNTQDILTELRTSNAHLCTLTESHHERLGRIEMQMDKKR